MYKRVVTVVLAVSMSLTLFSADVWAETLMECSDPSDDYSGDVSCAEMAAPENSDTYGEELPAEASGYTKKEASDVDESAEDVPGKDPKRSPDEEHNKEKLTTQEVIGGWCGDNVKWSLDTYTGVMTISGTGEMESYYNYHCPWYDYRTDIKSVNIQYGVTNIGDVSFNGCSNMTSVSIPSSVKRIGISAFGSCTGLTAISIPESVTYIDKVAFYGCTGLNDVTLPKRASLSQGAFLGCTGLKSVVLPGSLKGIDPILFSGCSSLTSISIPKGVTYIDRRAFDGCSSLSSVSIPKDVTFIGESAFDYCSSLSSITVLSKKAEIERYALGYIEKNGKKIANLNCTIYGYAGSTAEYYAKKNGIRFKALKSSSSKLTTTKLSKVTVKKNVATVTWKKNTTGKGYQLQYSTDKKFKKSVKTVKVKKNKTVKATVKKLKTGTWYFRIRTVNEKKTSGWSKVKSAKVK